MTGETTYSQTIVKDSTWRHTLILFFFCSTTSEKGWCSILIYPRHVCFMAIDVNKRRETLTSTLSRLSLSTTDEVRHRPKARQELLRMDGPTRAPSHELTPPRHRSPSKRSLLHLHRDPEKGDHHRVLVVKETTGYLTVLIHSSFQRKPPKDIRNSCNATPRATNSSKKLHNRRLPSGLREGVKPTPREGGELTPAQPNPDDKLLR